VFFSFNSARADAGTKSRLKAQCERANRELTREKEALGRIAKRLGEMQGAQGEASSIRLLAEAEAESVKAKYTELALKVSGAQKATADATLLASTATAELELAVRAKAFVAFVARAEAAVQGVREPAQRPGADGGGERVFAGLRVRRAVGFGQGVK